MELAPDLNGKDINIGHGTKGAGTPPGMAASARGPVPSSRIYFMDAMRSVLMILGVVLHSAQVFNPARTWYVYSQDTSVFAGLLVQVIHLFRMPAFFVLAGYFCALNLSRWEPRRFLQVRLTRIGVPLLFCALTLNSLQAMVLDKSGWLQFQLGQYLLKGGWILHLWFLNNLVVYFLLAAGVALVFGRLVLSLVAYLTVWATAIPQFAIVLMLPLASVGILGLAWLGVPFSANLGGIIDVEILALYSPYFLGGIFIFLIPGLLRGLLTISPIALVAVLAISVMLETSLQSRDVAWHSFARYYCHSLIIWSAIILCLMAFKRFFDKPSRLWSFLSDGSYTVYLTHQVMVVALGLLLIESGIGGMAGAAGLMTIVLALTLLFHKYVVLRIPVLRFLFNGKKPARYDPLVGVRPNPILISRTIRADGESPEAK